MSEKTVTLRVKRYRPAISEKPYYQDYQVPYRNDMVVLDALNHVKDEVDSTLTYRWSCRMGICGSCGATVNGVPKLTCAVYVKDLKGDVIEVEPLYNFPVIKDLVVDISDFMEKLEGVKPWIIREDEKPIEQGEYLQTPEQMDLYHQFSMCINCMLCYAACPVYGADKHFVGPAAAALGYRYILDSRDKGREDRLTLLMEHGTWDCTFVGECSVVCPKKVDPAIALQRVKLMGAMETIKSLLMPRGGK